MVYNFFISLCAGFLSLSVFYLLDFQVGKDEVVSSSFIACTSFFTYAMLKKQLQLSLLIVLPFSLIFFFFYSFSTSVYGLHLMLLTYLYASPLKLSSRIQIYPLRNYPIVKMALLSYVWTSATLVLPLMMHECFIPDATMGLLFFERFLFIAGISLVFDIRDYRSDRRSELKTIPVLLGIKGTKQASLLLLTAFLFTSFYHYNGLLWYAFLVTGVVASLSIYNTHLKRGSAYYTIFLDGAMALHFLLIFLVRNYPL
ncbi:MAG: UbiA family prenyltransferase [Cytophagaceae bacterium]